MLRFLAMLALLLVTFPSEGSLPRQSALSRLDYTRGLDLSGSLQGAGGIGGLLARTDHASSSSYFYHADGAGNVTALSDAQGRIAARYLYNPFGRLIAKWGPMADVNRYQFSSKESDYLSGLSYYGYRFYDPTLQRWLTRDPLGEAGGVNLYGFVGNDPISRVDPLGLTYLVSETPFPGQEGTYGPYVLNVPDGSSLIKTPIILDRAELLRRERSVCKRLHKKAPLAFLDPMDEAKFDTDYFKGYNPDAREYYWYDGKIYADNEINYFGIGMYENWAGRPLPVAEGITYLWKMTQYGEIANENTIFWLDKGYMDYSRITRPEIALPK